MDDGCDLEATDDELIARTAKGDAAAFTALVTRHRARLMAQMMRSLGNRAAAEDIVQEVFVRAWTNAPNWRAREPGRASYAAWLSRVALNLAIDQSRRAKPVTLDAIAEPPDPSASADAIMMDTERSQRIRAAIDQLPERQRTALSLTYDAELSNAEGAAAMSTSIGAFELLLVRARRALRQSLRDE